MKDPLETDPNEFDLGHFPCFSQSFLSLCNLPQGKASPHRNIKGFLVFILSVEDLLEADSNEFLFGTYNVFFS